LHGNLLKKVSTVTMLVSIMLAGLFYAPVPASAADRYIVSPGDTLYQIAKKYQMSVDEIMQYNSLKSHIIYVGQALVIPSTGQYHVVARGESLYLIAKLYGMSVTGLKQINGLTGDTIHVGQYLKVNAQGYQRPKAMIIGYYTDDEPNLGSSFWSASTHMNSMSRLAPFWFRLNQTDPTQLETTDTFNETEARKVIAATHAQGVPVIPVIYNFLYQERSLPRKLVNQLVSSEQNRRESISNIIKLIENYDFDGVNMDFEGIRTSDRENLSIFYQELGEQLRARGYIFTVAVPAKSKDDINNSWTAPYDYVAIGKAADQVMLMMYNEHGFPGSGPGPVSSIGFNHTDINYAIKTIPARKIILAEPLFGFDFNLDTNKYDYLSHELAMRRVRDFRDLPTFDFNSQTPFFQYVDPHNNQRHEVWYENTLSLKRKLELIRQYDLGGVALWRLGMEDPAIWTAINEKVIVSR